MATRTHPALIATAVVAALAGTLTLASPLPPAAEAPRFSHLAHVGLLVRDARRTARAWAEAFDVEVTPLQTVATGGFPRGHRGNPRAHLEAIEVRLDNLVLEVAQPTGGSSPWREFLNRHDEGIHHLAVTVPDVAAAARELERLGGHRTVGRAGASTAFIDFDAQMGGGIELLSAPGTDVIVSGTPRPHATVIALGHLTAAIEPARQFWGTLLGVEVPAARETRGVPFPADCRCDREAYIREVNLRALEPGIDLVQPEGGPSIWRRLVERHQGLAYLQFDLPDQAALDQRVAALLALGGVRTLGDTGAPYAYIDMQRQLGVTLLLRSAAPR